MAGEIERAMKDLGIDLPKPAIPVANYIPCVIAGSLLYVSGQLPIFSVVIRPLWARAPLTACA